MTLGLTCAKPWKSIRMQIKTQTYYKQGIAASLQYFYFCKKKFIYSFYILLLMLRKRKQMNRTYSGLLHCFAVRNDTVRLKYRSRTTHIFYIMKASKHNMQTI